MMASGQEASTLFGRGHDTVCLGRPRARSGHHTPICAFSCPRVGHLSRQFLEKLTDSAIIKVAP
jgi:hypothetical protein